MKTVKKNVHPEKSIFSEQHKNIFLFYLHNKYGKMFLLVLLSFVKLPLLVPKHRSSCSQSQWPPMSCKLRTVFWRPAHMPFLWVGILATLATSCLGVTQPCFSCGTYFTSWLSTYLWLSYSSTWPWTTPPVLAWQLKKYLQDWIISIL